MPVEKILDQYVTKVTPRQVNRICEQTIRLESPLEDGDIAIIRDKMMKVINHIPTGKRGTITYRDQARAAVVLTGLLKAYNESVRLWAYIKENGLLETDDDAAMEKMPLEKAQYLANALEKARRKYDARANRSLSDPDIVPILAETDDAGEG